MAQAKLVYPVVDSSPWWTKFDDLSDPFETVLMSKDEAGL